MKKWIFAGGIALVIAGIILVFNFSAQEVELYQVKEGTIKQTIEETGLVQASKHSNIYSMESGQVEELLVRIGSTVSQGDRLLVLSNHDLKLQKNTYQNSLAQSRVNFNLIKADLDKAKLDLDEAINNYVRMEKLYDSGALSKNELTLAKLTRDKYDTNYRQLLENLKQVEEQVEIAQNALNDISAKEDNLIITSPIDGVIVGLPVKKGEFISPGREVAEVANLARAQVKAMLLSDDMADIKLGQRVNISAPILKNKILTGQVMEIYPQAEEKPSALGVVQYRVPVIISLEEKDILKPAYEVQISIETAVAQDVPIIPREALIYRENRNPQVILINEKGRIEYHDVQLGLSDKANLEIASGLQAGQKIVLDTSNLLKAGTKVKGI